MSVLPQEGEPRCKRAHLSSSTASFIDIGDEVEERRPSALQPSQDSMVSGVRCVICWETNHAGEERVFCCPRKHPMCRKCFHHLLAGNRLQLRKSCCPVCRCYLSYSETNAHPCVYSLYKDGSAVAPEMPLPPLVTLNHHDPDVSQEVMVSLVLRSFTLLPLSDTDVSNNGDSRDYLYFESEEIVSGAGNFLLRFYVNSGNKTRHDLLDDPVQRNLFYQLIRLPPDDSDREKLHVSYNATPCLIRLGQEIAGPPQKLMATMERQIRSHRNSWEFSEQDDDEVKEGHTTRGNVNRPSRYVMLSTGNSSDTTGTNSLSVYTDSPRSEPITSHSRIVETSSSPSSMIITGRSVLNRSQTASEEGSSYGVSQELAVSMTCPCCSSLTPPLQQGGRRCSPCHELDVVTADVIDCLLAKGQFMTTLNMWLQKYM